MRLEEEGWWNDLVAKKDTVSLRDLAKEFGTTPGAISMALKRTGTSRVPKGEALAPDASEATRPGSKDADIEPYAQLLGQVPDAEVADKAGVSVRTIASYRSRNQIAGYQGRAAPKKRRQRKSKIDPYLDLLGQVPDRVVAQKAGVTLNAVRNYRTTRGIPSSRGRGGREVEAQEVETVVDRPRVTRAPRTAPATPVAPVEAAPAQAFRPPVAAASGRHTWRLVFEIEADSVVEVADAAAAAGLGQVVAIERLPAS